MSQGGNKTIDISYAFFHPIEVPRASQARRLMKELHTIFSSNKNAQEPLKVEFY